MLTTNHNAGTNQGDSLDADDGHRRDRRAFLQAMAAIAGGLAAGC